MVQALPSIFYVYTVYIHSSNPKSPKIGVIPGSTFFKGQLSSQLLSISASLNPCVDFLICMKLILLTTSAYVKWAQAIHYLIGDTIQPFLDYGIPCFIFARLSLLLWRTSPQPISRYNMYFVRLGCAQFDPQPCKRGIVPFLVSALLMGHQTLLLKCQSQWPRFYLPRMLGSLCGLLAGNTSRPQWFTCAYHYLEELYHMYCSILSCPRHYVRTHSYIIIFLVAFAQWPQECKKWCVHGDFVGAASVEVVCLRHPPDAPRIRRGRLGLWRCFWVNPGDGREREEVQIQYLSNVLEVSGEPKHTSIKDKLKLIDIIAVSCDISVCILSIDRCDLPVTSFQP